MKPQLKLLVIGHLLSALGLSAHAQGILTPPGAPAATMKTLGQIEPRTPISDAPYTISEPGSYYLTTNLTVSSGTAITIATNGVTLDLNGYTIRSTAASATGSGVYIKNWLSDISIANGHICGGVTNNGSGIFSGSGFGSGIYEYTDAINNPNGADYAKNVLVSRVSVSGCLSQGIFLGGAPSAVENCVARTTGSGIIATTIKSCQAQDCGGQAIIGGQVSDSNGTSVGSTGVSASTAINCNGSSSSGTGLSALTAQNCNGISISGTGLSATTAQNCYGTSSTGTGLSANNASFCTGYRFGGTAIQATIATGCIAAVGTNIITYKYNMP